jgi:hypothetical protein
LTALQSPLPLGSGTFTLHVTFHLENEFKDGEMVHCTYVKPDGGTTTISDFIPEPDDVSHDIVFTATQPGLYSAGCQSIRSGSSRTAAFTVTGNATPTPANGANPTPTAEGFPVPTATLPAVTLKGQIIFDYADAQSTRGPGWGGLLSDVTKG